MCQFTKIIYINKRTSIFYTIYQENIEIFLLGLKPPGPNRERAETSWGRTGKGPKPLAFKKSAFHNYRQSTIIVVAEVKILC